MKIVDAFWEERNLGKKTAEIEVEKGDSIREIREILVQMEKEKDYLVVKLPPAFLCEWEELESRGYRFAECLLSFSIKIQEFHEERKDFFFFREEQGIEAVDSFEKLTFLQEEIRKGIFVTDRVALSPSFGPEKANFRYSMWIEDLFSKKGSFLFFISWKGRRVGFFSVQKRGEKSAQGLLAGIFPEFRRYPFGLGILYHPLVFLKNGGFKKYSAVVSSNNFPVVKLYEYFGFRIGEIKKVFIKLLPEK